MTGSSEGFAERMGIVKSQVQVLLDGKETRKSMWTSELKGDEVMKKYAK
jgi:hypothetical protein